jgi:hypothetical protein
MFKQIPFPTKCKICEKKVENMEFYSSISNTKIIISKCPDGHNFEIPIELVEVCPYCMTKAILRCNCIQTTKTCANGHSWLICRKCKHITKSETRDHIVSCEKCEI